MSPAERTTTSGTPGGGAGRAVTGPHRYGAAGPHRYGAAGPHRYGRWARIAPPRELDSGDRDGARALVGRMAVELRAPLGQ
ncbi:hypothetical protein ACIQEY_29675 [Streptomyces parvus]|uniref:hypothetical protein n=1 Tax=Streptomyces parvus TaxID=66428 RepID=UPI00380B8F50